MNSVAKVKLRPGIALSAAQMARLIIGIVWYAQVGTTSRQPHSESPNICAYSSALASRGFVLWQ
jgi:hypothetical protein